MRYQCSKFVQIGTLGFPFYYEAQIVGPSSFPAPGMSKGLCRLWELQGAVGNNKEKGFPGDTV